MVPGRCQEGLLGGVESREATQAVQLSLAYAGPSASAGDKSATALPAFRGSLLSQGNRGTNRFEQWNSNCLYLGSCCCVSSTVLFNVTRPLLGGNVGKHIPQVRKPGYRHEV
jgi:hypothetical protein